MFSWSDAPKLDNVDKVAAQVHVQGSAVVMVPLASAKVPRWGLTNYRLNATHSGQL